MSSPQPPQNISTLVATPMTTTISLKKDQSASQPSYTMLNNSQSNQSTGLSNNLAIPLLKNKETTDIYYQQSNSQLAF